jgi:hypothetical protein
MIRDHRKSPASVEASSLHHRPRHPREISGPGGAPHRVNRPRRRASPQRGVAKADGGYSRERWRVLAGRACRPRPGAAAAPSAAPRAAPRPRPGGRRGPCSGTRRSGPARRGAARRAAGAWSSVTTASRSSRTDAPGANGGRAQIISYSRTPMPHTSVRPSMGSRATCSGAMIRGVPTTPALTSGASSVRLHAMPKSISLRHVAATVVGEHDVLALDVAVDEAGAMHRRHGVGDADRDLERVRDGERATLHALHERGAARELHDEERSTGGVVAEVEDLDDAGVADRAGDAGLAEEQRAGLGRVRQLGRQPLDGDRAIDHHVARQVHRGHAAGAQLAVDLVAAEAFLGRRLDGALAPRRTRPHVDARRPAPGRRRRARIVLESRHDTRKPLSIDAGNFSATRARVPTVCDVAVARDVEPQRTTRPTTTALVR